MKLIYCFMIFLWPFVSTGQKIKPLTIGDTVPDITLSQMLNYSSASAKLSDFKGKLVILDFWSTWCGSCIALFPHLDSLQKEFGKDLQIILVNTKSRMTKDDETKIKKVLERVRTRTGINLDMPVVYNSEEVDRYFPCIVIPHEVWINKDGKVIGITSSDEVSDENIKSILKGRKVQMKLKKDRSDVDLQRPLFIDGNGGNGNETIYRSMVTRYIDGLNGSTGIMQDDNKTTGLYLINQSLCSITKMIYATEIAHHYSMIHINRFIIEAKDNSKFDTKSSDSFYYQNLFSYELILPPSDDATIYKYARQDLKRYFNISVKYEIRNMKCLVLKAPDGIKDIKKGGKEFDLEKSSLKKFIHNSSPQFVASLLNEYSKIPLIDETHNVKKISVDLPYNLNDLGKLKEAFLKTGISLKEENRKLEVVVITDK